MWSRPNTVPQHQECRNTFDLWRKRMLKKFRLRLASSKHQQTRLNEAKDSDDWFNQNRQCTNPRRRRSPHLQCLRWLPIRHCRMYRR